MGVTPQESDHSSAIAERALKENSANVRVRGQSGVSRNAEVSSKLFRQKCAKELERAMKEGLERGLGMRIEGLRIEKKSLPFSYSSIQNLESKISSVLMPLPTGGL